MLSKVHNNFIEPKLFAQFVCIINTRAGMPLPSYSWPGKQAKTPTPAHTERERETRHGQVYEEIFALEANTLGTHNQISCIF